MCREFTSFTGQGKKICVLFVNKVFGPIWDLKVVKHESISRDGVRRNEWNIAVKVPSTLNEQCPGQNLKYWIHVSKGPTQLAHYHPMLEAPLTQAQKDTHNLKESSTRPSS